MKTLLTTIILLLIYIAPANAQGPSIQNDPLTRHILTLENPCEDDLYLELRQIDLEEMTDRQFEIFRQKDQACQEYQNLLRSTEAQNRAVEVADRGQRNITKYLIFSGIITTAALLIISGSY